MLSIDSKAADLHGIHDQKYGNSLNNHVPTATGIRGLWRRAGNSRQRLAFHAY